MGRNVADGKLPWSWPALVVTEPTWSWMAIFLLEPSSKKQPCSQVACRKASRPASPPGQHGTGARSCASEPMEEMRLARQLLHHQSLDPKTSGKALGAMTGIFQDCAAPLCGQILPAGPCRWVRVLLREVHGPLCWPDSVCQCRTLRCGTWVGLIYIQPYANTSAANSCPVPQ